MADRVAAEVEADSAAVAAVVVEVDSTVAAEADPTAAVVVVRMVEAVAARTAAAAITNPNIL